MTFEARSKKQSFPFSHAEHEGSARFALVFSQVIDEGDSLCDHSDGSCHDNHKRYHV